MGDPTAAEITLAPEADSDDDGQRAAAASRRPGFAALAGSSEESGEGIDAKSEQQAQGPRVAAAPKAKAGKKQKRKQKQRKGGGAAPGVTAEEDDDALLVELASSGPTAQAKPAEPEERSSEAQSVLAMHRANFSADRERRRIFGRHARDGEHGSERRLGPAARDRGGHEGLLLHHRKLFLVELASDEQWPRPQHCAEMLVVADAPEAGAACFRIRTTPAHTRLRHALARAQLTHDPEEIHEFVLQQPFCIEALLVLAEISRQGGNHEQAFRLVRRAVYAVECGFAAGFSPFAETGLGRLRVRLLLPAGLDPADPAWPWLGALWTYALGLHAQGLHRTSVEVCKLLLASTLPRDPFHVLAHLDVILLRARLYAPLRQFSLHLCEAQEELNPGAVARLDSMLPNFAYSVALASHFAQGRPLDLSALNKVDVARIHAPLFANPRTDADLDDPSSEPHAALMRALWLFPQVLVPLLEALNVKPGYPAPAGSPYRSTWQELIGRPPFLRSADCRHRRHFLVLAQWADGYGLHCAPLWRGKPMLCWLHACAGRLAQICESSLFAEELQAARRAWSEAPLGLDEALAVDYGSLNLSELGPQRTPPLLLQNALTFDFGLQAALRHAAVPAAEAAAVADADGEEAQLARALALSAQIAEASQRRALVLQQDDELRESLAVDEARAAGFSGPQPPDPPGAALGGEAPAGGAAGAGAPPEAHGAASPAALSLLLDMGFEDGAARRALEAAGGDLDAAVGRLTS